MPGESEERLTFMAWAKAEGLLAHADEAQQRPGYAIQSDGAALWALRVLEALRDEVAHRTQERDRVLAEYDAWVDEARRAYQQKEAWLSGLLEGYARQCEASGRLQGKKSLSLPGGRRIGWRRRAWAHEVRDDDAFTAWCERYGLARTRVEPDMAAVRRRWRVGEDGTVEADVVDEATGEVTVVPVPGVAVQLQARDVFGMTLAGKPLAEPDESDGVPWRQS